MKNVLQKIELGKNNYYYLFDFKNYVLKNKISGNFTRKYFVYCSGKCIGKWPGYCFIHYHYLLIIYSFIFFKVSSITKNNVLLFIFFK